MIVVSHDGFNQTANWKSVIVVPVCTSKGQAKRGPTTVELSGAGTGLARTSIAVCHQVTTLDRAKLTKLIGAVAGDRLRAVEDGLKAALDLDA